MPLKGKVMVSVPGGTPVYEGDLAELQRRQMVNAGQTVPLHEVLIPREALPDPAVVAVATYGDVNATGVSPPSEMSHEELVRLSEGYDNDTGLDEIMAALGVWKGGSGDPGDTGGSGSAWHFLLYMAVALGVLAIAALILFIPPAPIPVSRPGTVVAAYAGWPNAMQKHSCLICGAAMPEQAKFCASCGTASAASCEKSVCAGCGGMLAPNTMYCAICGKPAEVRGEAPASVCPDCGTHSPKSTEFCTKCGRALSGRQP
jgi:ribosomal protein L40E